MPAIAYFRVSTTDQTIESQRSALIKATGVDKFYKEFSDIGVSGATPAAQRPGFAQLLAIAREGDVIYVAAVDRLGRDAIDVQATVRELIQRDVTVHVQGLGAIGKGAGELILAVLAQVADMERHRIKERTAAGREAARAALQSTGKTHRGKDSLGRPKAANAAEVLAWKAANSASIQRTATHFDISAATVKRYASEAKKDSTPAR